MTWEIPDRTEDHYPEGGCSCGRDLADAEDLGVTRSFQQEELLNDEGLQAWAARHL